MVVLCPRNAWLSLGSWGVAQLPEREAARVSDLRAVQAALVDTRRTNWSRNAEARFQMGRCRVARRVLDGRVRRSRRAERTRRDNLRETLEVDVVSCRVEVIGVPVLHRFGRKVFEICGC